MAKVVSVDTYRDKLIIDPDNLLDDVVTQAKLCWEVSELATDAVAERDAAKLNMEQLETELNKVKRDKLAKGEGRVTEAMVTTAVGNDERMQTAQAEYLAAKEAADKWTKLLDAFHQRSNMLKLATQIMLRQLFLDEDAARLEGAAGALRSQQGEAATRRQRAKYANEPPVRRPRAK